jgi:hypothetical protein
MASAAESGVAGRSLGLRETQTSVGESRSSHSLVLVKELGEHRATELQGQRRGETRSFYWQHSCEVLCANNKEANE